MRKLIVIGTGVLLLCATSIAQAGGGHRHHGGHWGAHWGGHGGGHWGSHLGVHLGYHGRARDVLGVIAGGLILGSILDHAFRPRHHDHEYYANRHYRSPRRFQEPAYHERVTRREFRRSRPLPQQTHLHRDRHGNCFEVSYAVDGTERRAELPRSQCAW